MSIYLSIATMEGSAYTSWGPCFCNEEDSECKSCKTANKIEELGLDWDVEYEKARLNNFEDVDY